MLGKLENLRKILLDAEFDVTVAVLDSLPEKNVLSFKSPKFETMELPEYKFMKHARKVNGKRKRNPDRWR